MNELQKLQMEREYRAVHLAKSKALQELQRALANGNVEQLPASRALIARVFQVVAEHISTARDNKTRGPGANLRNWLRALEVDVLTVMTIRSVISGVLMHGMNASIQRLASALGYAIVQEVRIRNVEEVNPVYLQRTQEYLRSTNTTAKRHIQRTMDAVIKNVLGEQQDLSNAELMHLGKHGVAACVEAGIIRLNKRKVRGRDFATFELTDEVSEILSDVAYVFPHPNPGAMLVPPDPWTDFSTGGYLTNEVRRRFPFMSFHYPSTRKETRRLRVEGIRDAERVREVVNYLQAEPFRIHDATADLLLRVWETGGGAMGIPSRKPRPRPEFPHPAGWDKAEATEEELIAFSNWKRHMASWHTAELERKGIEVETAELVRNHREIRDRPIYFPMMTDFRNRMYYHGTPNPQGSDPAKAAVHFNLKKPLGPRGLFWLKVHIANCMGYDKVRMAERARWVDEHWESFREALQAPMDSPVWGTQADAAFGAYSACMELNAAYASGNPEAYCSGIPIHMDATCSGLQHFSALLRDPVGARYTNLVDHGEPQKADIYARVLELVQARLERDSNPLHPNHPEARAWLSVGLKRDLTKRPTMTFVYGVTHRGVADHCSEYIEASGIDLDPKLGRSMAYYMANVLFDSLGGAVPAAAACMSWLRDVAKLVPSDQPMHWRNPVGFPVVQDYREHTERRVHLRSAGVDYVIVREWTDRTKTRRMTNGVCPNFIHSMDAAHLSMVAERMRDSGLSMVGVHDSIGTHPCDVDTLHRHIREAFVDLYDQDHLSNLLTDLGVTAELPAMGDFDLRKVLNSEFFFC